MDIDLISTGHLHDGGLSDRAIRARIDDGTLVRLRAGIFVDGARWRALHLEDRLVLRSRAWAATAEHRPLIVGASAAALHGLPLVFTRRESVDTMIGDPRRGRTPGVVRRRMPTDSRSGAAVEVATVERDGMRCTDLATTVVDVARYERRETAIAVTDAALRRFAGPDPRRPDWEGVERTRDRMLQLAAARTHGRRRAVSVILAADPRAEGPGESVSRDRLLALGADVRSLQPALAAPGGGWYYPDFEIGSDVFGEFDGDAKYLDPRLLAGRDTARVILDEKRREDWLRATTSRRFVRWGWPPIETVSTFGRFLVAHGVSLDNWPIRSRRGR